MKTRLTALLTMLAVMISLAACSTGTHRDLEVSSKDNQPSSFSEGKQTEPSSQPDTTVTPESSEDTAETISDAEESDTSIQASAASESESVPPGTNTPQTKPSSTDQPQIKVSEEQPQNEPQTAQESTPEPVKPQSTEKPTPQPTEAPMPEPTPEPVFDIGYWVSYAQSYAQSKGLNLEASATDCWDNPISAGINCTSTESNIISRINRYANDEDITDVWIWAESTGNGNFDLYIGYA